MSVSEASGTAGGLAGAADGTAGGSAGTAGGTGSVVVRGPGEGPGTWVLGSLFERLASGEETGGGIGVSLVTQPPGTATPVHVHTLEDEAFYLLDGTMTYSADGELHRLAQGSFIYLPRGRPHAFRVTGDAPVRFLAIATPGALMSLYDEVGRPALGGELPPANQDLLMADVHRWLETAPRYGLTVVGPPLPRTLKAPGRVAGQEIPRAGTTSRQAPDIFMIMGHFGRYLFRTTHNHGTPL